MRPTLPRMSHIPETPIYMAEGFWDIPEVRRDAMVWVVRRDAMDQGGWRGRMDREVRRIRGTPVAPRDAMDRMSQCGPAIRIGQMAEVTAKWTK